ncbi:hypothetical protein GDO81_001027 [Engystomops pustulosus]|uniref:Endonuclease/exonuclease/phosphatase domain-containing protein n=1 Tax=Engystomops pustulosus TaxID=76066 RepID=A0AAV7DCP8_ENGPU|nr:hypothetical protein GDO81_001027 [Engystomops pustulosus]
MSSLTFSSFNVRGLNSSSKRGQIVYHFHRQRTMALLLQETHYNTDYNRYYNKWFYSPSPIHRAKGVAIAFHYSFSPQILNSTVRSIREILVCEGELGVLTFGNVYFPNSRQVSFGIEALRNLRELTDGSPIILGGDFLCSNL